MGRARRREKEEREDFEDAGPDDSGGDESANVKEALRGLRDLSTAGVDEIAAQIAVVEAEGSQDGIVNGRVNAYRSIVEFERTGAIEGHAQSAEHAVLELNELRNGALRFDVARTASSLYMTRFPEAAAKLGRADALLRGPGRGGGRWRDDAKSDFQVIPKPGAETTIVVFCDFRERFNMPINTLYHVWLCDYPANIIILRDWERLLYLLGVPSIGTQEASVAELKRTLESLGTKKIVTIGNSGGGHAALHYAVLLGGTRAVAFAPPIDLGYAVSTMKKRGRLMSGLTDFKDQGRIVWPDLPQMYRDNPQIQARIFCGERQAVDRPHAERMLDIPNVTVSWIPDANAHGLLGMIAEQGLLQESFDDAVYR